MFLEDREDFDILQGFYYCDSYPCTFTFMVLPRFQFGVSVFRLKYGFLSYFRQMLQDTTAILVSQALLGCL